MPRPTVEVDTIDELNAVIEELTDAPPHELDFEAKVGVLVEKVKEQDDRIQSLKRFA